MTELDNQADIEQERQADYRILNVRGQHDAIGKHLGEVTPLRTIPKRSPGKPDPEYAWACLKAIGIFHPGIEAEYQGFAEVKGLPFEQLLSHISLNVVNGQIGQCSTVGHRARTGQVIIGRNYDFRYSQRLRYLVHTAPSGYAAHVGTNSGLVGGRYDGVNEYGVFVSLHTVMANRPKSVKPGIPFHLVVRIALETCRTAHEAMNTIRQMPLFHSFNYFVADRDDMYLLEAHPTRVEVTGGRANILAATNHFQHPALQKLHGRRRMQHSRKRLFHLRQEPGRWAEGAGPVQATQQLMRDHSTPICGHQDGAATLWSAVCDPAEKKLTYALGAPCRNPYQPIPWPGKAWAASNTQ